MGSSKVLFRRFEERDAEGIRGIYPQFFEDCDKKTAKSIVTRVGMLFIYNRHRLSN